MKHSFPLPASSDDELFEQLVKISPITKEAMLSFEEDLKEMYSSLATPGWEEYASIPSSNSNYPFIYEYVAVRWKKEALERMPENKKLRRFIEDYKPVWKNNYLLDANYKIDYYELDAYSKITFSKVNQLVLHSQSLPALCAYLIAVKYPKWYTYDFEAQKQILTVELPEFDYDFAKKAKEEYDDIQSREENTPF